MTFSNSGSSFGALDLSKVETSGGLLDQPGRYVVNVKDAVFEDYNGGKRVKLVFEEPKTKRVLTHSYNTYVPGNESKQAGGQKAFKRFLIAGNHPTPDAPKDINSLKGMTVGIEVVRGEKYVDKYNQEAYRINVKNVFDPTNITSINNDADAEYKEFMAHAAKQANGAAAPAAQEPLEDAIPF